jgi:SAM-dependent methyltransferase
MKPGGKTPAKAKAAHKPPAAAVPPINVLRLSFDSHRAFLDYGDTNAKMLKHVVFWHETLGNRETPLEMPGICDLCERKTVFTAVPEQRPHEGPFAFRVPWARSARCHCGMALLQRSVFRALLDGGAHDDQVYHIGHRSNFRRFLAERLPNMTTSEFEAGRGSGEVDGEVRYEDLTGLTFADRSFDSIICMEVLDRIFDYPAALREMSRVLKRGGRALLTFPWLGGEHYGHLARDRGDPAAGGYTASIRAFGWKVLDELREAGFSRASANYVFGPLHGYMTLSSPVIVAVR